MLAALAVALLDQLSKAWALATLGDGPGRALWPRHLYLEVAHNAGAALGLLQSHPLLSTALTLGLMAALLVWWRAVAPKSHAAALGVGAALGGAGSNLADRLLRDQGAVDMVVVILSPGHRLPAFNLADAAVTAALLGLTLIAATRIRDRQTPQCHS